MPTAKKLPNLSRPKYGFVFFGLGEQRLVYTLILDEPAGQTEKTGFQKLIQSRKLYIDVNRNGDFTDDPKPQAADLSTVVDSPETGHRFAWSFNVPVYQGGKLVEGSVYFEYYVPEYPTPYWKGRLVYSTDFGLAGTIRVAGREYKAALRDIGPLGTYSPYARRGAYLWRDRDDDGQLDSSYERFSIGAPFNLDGNTYQIEDMEPSGARFTLKPSKVHVAERPVPKGFIPKVGNAIPPFSRKSLNGKTVSLPGDFKGSYVLVDFWATWCGPCLAEAPNLRSALERFKKRGLVVLGISLDEPALEDTVRETISKHNLVWEHIYDGQGWKSELAKIFRVDYIPKVFLIDGDTGTILASGDELRGKQLLDTLESLLPK